jgi:hypothetical protein
MDILGRYDLDAIALCQVDKDALVLAHDVDALIGQQYLLIICRLNSKYFFQIYKNQPVRKVFSNIAIVTNNTINPIPSLKLLLKTHSCVP